MTKFKIYPYKIGSESARQLARTLNVTRVKADGNYKYFRNHIIINWGSSLLPSWMNTRHTLRVLNHPHMVYKASNKKIALECFERQNIPCPKFFFNKEDVIRYTAEQANFPIIYCRTALSGHSGRGIILANDVSELVNAPLYTVRFKANREWRVHVFQNNVIDFAKKSRRNGEDDRASGLIRNYDSGWIFRRGDLLVPSAVSTMAIRAVGALGLDFGAVDIAEDKDGNVCVYEVNTACGIGGETTLASYTNAFTQYLRGR